MKEYQIKAKPNCQLVLIHLNTIILNILYYILCMLYAIHWLHICGIARLAKGLRYGNQGPLWPPAFGWELGEDFDLHTVYSVNQ